MTMCPLCGYMEVFFKPGIRDANGFRIPHDRWGNIHHCDFTIVFPCELCGDKVYLDKKVLSPTGRRIPLNYGSDDYHWCRCKYKGPVQV